MVSERPLGSYSLDTLAIKFAANYADFKRLLAHSPSSRHLFSGNHETFILNNFFHITTEMFGSLHNQITNKAK